MVYFNTNRFLLNDFNTFKHFKNQKATKDAVIDGIRSSAGVSSDFSIFYFNNIYEAYYMLLYGVIAAYSSIKKVPHIISNSAEDPKINQILKKFISEHRITVTFISVNIYGVTDPRNIEAAIQKNKTCLIINSFINYFTGAVNDIKKIGEVAHRHSIPLFSDCVYSFGRVPIKQAENNIDIFTFDLNHPGLSFVSISNKLIKGYNLPRHCPAFDTTIELHNIEDPFIYGLAKSIIDNLFKNMAESTRKIMNTKKTILERLQGVYYDDFIKSADTSATKKEKYIIFGNHLGNDFQAPHILSIVLTKPFAKKNITLCKIDNTIFETIGITDPSSRNIITLGLHEYITKAQIDKLLQFLK
jgi:selenocysteine lyase/cysteine desulfurase